ncbi:hypothetical protein SESBI_30124 [Sesbania bispinosa]|nr:hypothetical protein SESBI_30124 [Sesbania bispinosa]
MENSSEAGASDKPPHKPPDGGGDRNTMKVSFRDKMLEGHETSPQTSMAAPESNHPPVATANANNGKVGEKSGVEDLHGDWMLVSRNKRSQKSRPLKNGNNDERSLISRSKSGGIGDKNSFGALQGDTKSGHNIPKDSKETNADFKFNVEGPKLLTRKKRSRREHIPILPTIVSNDKYKAIVDRFKSMGPSKEDGVGSELPKSLAKRAQSLVKSTHLEQTRAGPSNSPKLSATSPERCGLKGDQIGPIMKSASDNPKSPCESVRKVPPTRNSLPFGINTTMQVEVVSPNHLRMLDDNEPPDPGQLSSMIIEGHEQPIGGQSEVDMDESTSYEDEEVDMVGETQSVHG